MKIIDMESVFTITYVEVDDWYLTEGHKFLKGKRGIKPVFSDSEVMTLMLTTDYIPFPSETHFLNFVRANYLDLFPDLVHQSEFNRRSRKLRLLLEEFRKYLVIQLFPLQPEWILVDTKPIPVVGYKRSKRHSEFAGSAAYGYCASKNMHYFGYKLVVATTLSGFPLIYELVPANTDEREAAEVVLQHLNSCHVIGDKGFIGQDWQKRLHEQMGHYILTPKRKNQAKQNPPGFDRCLNKIRERIEGFFNQIQNVGRNIERLFAKTVQGLSTRIISKMTSFTLKHFLQRSFGINLLTFSAEENAII